MTLSPEPSRFDASHRWQAIALQGRNHWWRYLIGILLFLFFMQVLGNFAAICFAGVVMGFQGISLEVAVVEIRTFFATASIAGFIGKNIPFLFGLLALMIIMPLLHKRRFFSLLGAEHRLQWPLLLRAMGLWLAIVAGATFVLNVTQPSGFINTFQWRSWLLLLMVTLPLTFLQVACEELLFRGYLLQGLGILIRPKAALASVAAVPFALGHFANPEMQRGLGWMALYYFAFGWITCWMTLKRDRLEPALGFHLANNYFGILIVRNADSVFPVPAIFTVDAKVNVMFLVLLFVAEASLFYGIFERKWPWQPRVKV